MMKADTEKTARTTRIRATPYRTADRALCLLCEKPVKLLSFSEAAELFKTDGEEIENLAQTGKLHRIHNNRGTVMICAESLFCLFDSRPTQFLTLNTLSAGCSKA
jgi:hypothetical protein